MLKRYKNNKWPIRILVLFISITFGTLLSEILVRVIIPQQLVRDYTRADEDLGTVLRENATFHDNLSPEYYIWNVRTNAQGLRMDEPVSFNVHTKRVLMLGDSFTFGWGVEVEDSFVQLLSEKIISSQPNAQLLNAGIGAYSTGHVTKYLKRLHGITKPDKVIYFMNHNDMTDNVITNIDFVVTSFEITDEGVVTLTDKKVYSPFKRFLLTKTKIYPWANQNSHLFVLSKSVLKNILKIGPSPPDGPPRAMHQLQPNEANVATLVSLAHLTRLSAYCNKHQLPLLVVWIPHSDELRDGHIDLYHNFKKLAKDQSKENGFVFVDTLEKLSNGIGTQNIDDFYFAEGHYNKKGNHAFYQAALTAVEGFISK